MAKMTDITIKTETRFVFVKTMTGEVKGMFHRFTDSGSALVELKNGSILVVNPTEIKFVDSHVRYFWG